MTHLSKLNQKLAELHPAAFRCLSPMGKRLFFPKGIPVQAGQAKNCRYNGTIGQTSNDEGHTTPLPTMAKLLSGLSEDEVFQYQPQGGRKDLRNLWKDHIRKEIDCSISTPVVCMGLTHGLSIVADLFVDLETDVLLPNPRWGNYDLVFGARGNGNIINYDVMGGSSEKPNEWSFHLAGIASAISQVQKKGVLVLNVPSNPVGFTPTLEEVQQLVSIIKTSKKPLVILLDEAYKGMEWEADCIQHSLAQELQNLDPSLFLVVKVDGATKEMFFFGGRVAFVSFVCSREVAPLLEEKVIGSIRSSVSALPSPSQAMVVKALQSPCLEAEIASIRFMLKQRYLRLKEVLASSSLCHWKFNSAFFTLIDAPNGAEKTRLRLLEHDVGVISVPSANAIRLSYSTVKEDDLEPLISIIEKNI